LSDAARQLVEMHEQRVGFDPGIVTNPRVHAFYQHWLALKGEREFPSKAEFDPAALPQHLPGTLLLRVVGPPLDFEYRIIGEEVVARLGNLRGRRVREGALLNASSTAYRNYCVILEARRPQFLEGSAMLSYRDRPSRISRVHCPLSADGRTIDHILSYVAFM
jgi:hypothetical protein